ncbi:MAG: hypothetical protein KJ795_03995 [Gammaproteobacteria bacterium]|nr:hypothetical protein [Gammaproteobacteria bacterium]MBU1776473.1 hypothetical protein [Gammaproteobacteria bacterium]MBU1968890.1 hypothetical protein [Gammaproteobacteria bacterium]
MRSALNFAVLTVLLVMWILPLQVYGDQSSILAEVHRYSEQMSQFESGSSKQPLDDLYLDGDVLADELSEVLETLSDQDYELAQQEMKGFFVFREEIVGVKPKWLFFKELALSKGSKEDVDFFSFMADVYGDDIRPVYEEQVTDYSSCSSYGHGAMTRLYLAATRMKTPVNQVYRSAVDKVIAELKESLVDDNICVCDGPDTAIKELSLFVKMAKGATIRPDVKKLLAKIIAGTSKARFHCHPG